MGELIELITKYGVAGIITFICLLFMALKSLIEAIVWAYGWLVKWHNKKNQEDNQDISIDNRIKKLEDHDKWQYKKLIELSDGIKELKDLMINMRKDNDEFVVVTCRSQLYRIHQEATAQGYITKECLKTFSETGKKYEAAGGDDIYHDKLHPEVMALPIKD